MNQKIRLITVSSFALLGILCISSGTMYSKLQQKNVKQTSLVIVQQKRISKKEDIILKLKNFEIEVNTPLSVKIADYLEEPVKDEILVNLKLDTSNVNVTQPGVYQYVITYKQKEYNGSITVKEKQTPENVLTSITLKTINLKLGTPVPTDISNYVIEAVPEELKPQMKLDLSKVNINVAGTYLYSITYNNSVYTGTITVTEDQPILPAPTQTPTENISLIPKAIEIEEGGALSQNVADYLPEGTDEAIIKNAKLDLSKIDVNKIEQQEYTITYNGKSYTGYITVKKKTEETQKST